VRRAARSLLAALLPIALLAWVLPRSGPSAGERERCRAALSATGAAAALELWVGSSLLADGTLAAGRRGACDESAPAARVLSAAHMAAARVPRELLPERIVVHLDPGLPAGAARLRALETHVDSRSVFVDGASPLLLEPSAWLHEFGHLVSQGARPRGRAERRIFAVIEEGVADYYAAAVGGAARVGSDRIERDLEHPPRIEPERWLDLLRSSFDPHPFGWALAGALWRSEREPGPLLADLIAGLSRPTPLAAAVRADSEVAPAQVLRAFALRCPERSRAAIAAAIERAFELEIHGTDP
jgi:hypothetical protein